MKLPSLSSSAAALLTLAAVASANADAGRSSANYSVGAESYDSGGGWSQSSSYSATTSLESTSSGTSSSAFYTHSSGYLGAVTSTASTAKLLALLQTSAGSNVAPASDGQDGNSVLAFPVIANPATALGHQPAGAAQNVIPAILPNHRSSLSITVQADGSVRLTAYVPAGRSVMIESTDDLTSGTWQPLGRPKTGSPEGQVEWVESSANIAPQRFFRVMPADESTAASER